MSENVSIDENKVFKECSMPIKPSDIVPSNILEEYMSLLISNIDLKIKFSNTVDKSKHIVAKIVFKEVDSAKYNKLISPNVVIPKIKEVYKEYWHVEKETKNNMISSPWTGVLVFRSKSPIC